MRGDTPKNKLGGTASQEIDGGSLKWVGLQDIPGGHTNKNINHKSVVWYKLQGFTGRHEYHTPQSGDCLLLWVRFAVLLG